MKSTPSIGILGGMGPQAGIDLVSKIVANTIAKKDQDHIQTILISNPSTPDRTDFLFGLSTESPTETMIDDGHRLIASGVQAIGVACNTAHSPPIFDVFRSELVAFYPGLVLLNLIEETISAIQKLYPKAKKIGILGTKGTYNFRLYDDRLEGFGLVPVRPADIDILSDAIYDENFGIKACSNPVSERSRTLVLHAIEDVIEQGAELVILGCTELPLAVPETSYKNVPLIDPSTVLARALIHTVAPERLKPWRT